MNSISYFYLLRVPITTWLFMMFMAAGPFGGPGRSILEGIFDISNSDDTWFVSLVRFFVLAFAVSLNALAIALTARIIVVEGYSRFRLANDIPRGEDNTPHPGIELLFRALPAVAALFVVGAAIYQSKGSRPGGLIGAAVGFSVSYWTLPLAMKGVAKFADQLDSSWKWFRVPGDQSGYIDGAKHLRPSHKSAAVAVIISLLLYAAVGITKGTISFGQRPVPIVSTLVMIMVTLFCWIFVGLSFFLDRYAFRCCVLSLYIFDSVGSCRPRMPFTRRNPGDPMQR